MPQLEVGSGVHRYRGFGLNLAALLPIPGLREGGAGDPPDVTVELRRRGGAWPALPAEPTRPWRSHPVADAEGRPVLQVRRSVSGAWFHLRYADGTEFGVERRARRIWGAWPVGSTLEDAATYLVGPVLGFALRLRGTSCLHASAVSVEGSAIAFLGPPGAGKSTLAAAFARAGHALLADDAAALTPCAGRFLVQAGCPWIRLWPDSAEMLLGRRERLPRLTPSWDKRYLDAGPRFSPLSRPLAAVYVLAARGAADDRPRIESISAREALLALLRGSYMGVFQSAAMRAREFQLLTRLCAAVPVRRLRAPEGGRALAALCDAVADDVREGGRRP